MTSYPNEFTALGTACAIDSPALTFLPSPEHARRGPGWNLGLLPTFLPEEHTPPPLSSLEGILLTVLSSLPNLLQRAPSVAFFLFPEISPEPELFSEGF